MLETYAEQIASKCVHFTGIQKKQCVAGVAYDSFDGGLPCLANLGRGPKQPCSQIHFPTAEEIAEIVAGDEAHLERLGKALEAVDKDRKVRGFRKGKGGQGSLPCPACNTGTLGYSVASYNGHIHGRCSTPGCVSWMQ